MDSVSETSLIIVTCNSVAVLPQCLASLPAGLQVILVDNASSDASCQTAGDQGAQVIALPENKGFGTACNAGAWASTRPYLFFLNPDAVVHSGCIESLHATLSSRCDLSGLNPAMFNADGTRYLKRRSVLLPRALTKTKPDLNKPGPIPVLSGAAIYVRRTDFLDISGFDEDIFLFHEDDDLSIRLKAKGGLFLEPRAQVTHIGGGSSPRVPRTGRLKAFHLAQSKRHVLAKHGMKAVRIRLWTEAVAKILSPLNLISPWRRAKAVGFVWGLIKHQDHKYTG